MYPLIDKPFRCIDIYSRKAFVALWVQPYSLPWHCPMILPYSISLSLVLVIRKVRTPNNCCYIVLQNDID